MKKPANAVLSIGFPNIEWDSLSWVLGWATLQWQGWIRGSIKLSGNQNRLVALHATNVLEFWVDDVHVFGGDYYAYQRRPVMIDLSPGDHAINIRLARDVRVMGGTGQPDLPIQFSAEFCPNTLVVDRKSCIFPETVNGRPAGSYVAIAVSNFSRQNARIDSVECGRQGNDGEMLRVGALQSLAHSIY